MSCGCCTGACCAVFNLSGALTVDDLRRMGDPFQGETEKVVDMLVPLDPAAAVVRAEEFGADAVVSHARDGAPAFTCRHWSEHDRRCTIYEDRPQLCWSYPNGVACLHCGCTHPAAMREPEKAVAA